MLYGFFLAKGRVFACLWTAVGSCGLKRRGSNSRVIDQELATGESCIP